MNTFYLYYIYHVAVAVQFELQNQSLTQTEQLAASVVCAYLPKYTDNATCDWALWGMRKMTSTDAFGGTILRRLQF